jgi:hypothetical protein
MKSKKKERRKLIGCFLLCIGQELCWVNVFFFFFPCLRPFSIGAEFCWGHFFTEKKIKKKKLEDKRKEIKKKV